MKDIVADNDFKDDLGKAGSVAAMISLGLKLYVQARENAKTEDENAFSSLIEFTFKCADTTISNFNNISINNME